MVCSPTIKKADASCLMMDSGRIQSFEIPPVKKRINLLSIVLYFGHTSPHCFGVFSHEIIKIYSEIMADP